MNDDEHLIDDEPHKGWVLCACGNAYDASRCYKGKCPKCGKENYSE